MLNAIRSLIAIFIYLASLGGLGYCIFVHFSFLYLALSIGGFVLAHYIHPKRIKGATQDSLDVFEISDAAIDFTFKLLLLPFRFIGRFIEHLTDLS